VAEAAIAYLSSAAGAAAAANVVTYAVTAAVIVGYSNAQRRKAERRARDAANASLTGRNVTSRGTIEERQLIMGKVRTGGVLGFIGSTGPLKEKLIVVIAAAAHRCAGFEEFYFSDETLTLDGSGYAVAGSYLKSSVEVGVATMTLTDGVGSVVLPYPPIGTPWVVQVTGDDVTGVSGPGTVAGNTVSVSSFGGGSGASGTATVSYQYVLDTASIVSKARVRWMLGTSDQAAFPDLLTQFPDQWTANHRGRDVAYLVAELEYDQDIYPNGPPDISAVLRGTDEVFDPRTGATGYSENPALLMRWYLLHPFGGRKTLAEIDEASFIEAANVCDQVVNYGDGPRARFTAGYVASTDQVPASVCDELAEAMAGSWGYSGGVIRVRAGALSPAVATITKSWLAQGQTEIQPHLPRSQLGNAVQGTFIDPGSRWQQVPFPRVPQGAEYDALLAEDSGVPLAQEMEFGAITHVGQAQHVAAIKLREQRQGLTIAIDCNMSAYRLQMFDVVWLRLERYFGATPKLFEVQKRGFTLGGAIRLVMRETGAALFELGATVPAGDFLPNTSLPEPRFVPQMGAVTATSGATVLADNSVVTRVQLEWDAPADAAVLQGGFIELGFREGADTGEVQVLRADSYTGHTMVGLRGGKAHVFQVRAVNGLGVRGKWGPLTLHVVYVARGPKTFRQASAPTNPADDVRDEDRWIDTDDGLHPYLRVAGAWVSVRDATIAAAQSGADAAAAAAAAAQGDANTANSVLADIASDSVLTPDEKPRVIQDYTVILAEQAGIDGQATNYGVTTEKTTYDTAVAALTTYLGTLTSPVAWNNLTGNTTIVGATFRGKFADVYTSRQALLDAINAAAKARLGALATLNTVGTGEIGAGAATEVFTDEANLAGAGFGTTGNQVVRSFTVTPAVACVVEFSAYIEATNVDGDSGNAMGWQVTPSGGSAVILGSQNTPSAAKFKHTTSATYSAAAGVLLTFELRFSRPALNPSMLAYASYMRATLIKR